MTIKSAEIFFGTIKAMADVAAARACLRCGSTFWSLEEAEHRNRRVISQFGQMVGADAVFDFGGDTLTLKGFNLNQLADDQVIF